LGHTLIEKIITQHCGNHATPGEIVDVAIDVRAARDFGGAKVVQNLLDADLTVADPSKTIFTFDCNPGGSDQGYAANQHICRTYAREHGIQVRDIDQGIGTHIAIEEGLVVPGMTFVSTDSHANIMGAIGAFGQGMGDQDIAAAWANGRIWFKVPPTVLIVLQGQPGPQATAKDIVLRMAQQLGANGLLGCSAEITGDVVGDLDLASRITIASMATEMGGIIALFSPNDQVLRYCRQVTGAPCEIVAPDPDACYRDVVPIDIGGLEPQIRGIRVVRILAGCDAEIGRESIRLGDIPNPAHVETRQILLPIATLVGQERKVPTLFHHKVLIAERHLADYLPQLAVHLGHMHNIVLDRLSQFDLSLFDL